MGTRVYNINIIPSIFAVCTFHGQTKSKPWVKRLRPGDQYLHGKHGSDIAIVEAKVESKRFDWNTFLDSDCAKGAML